MASNGHRRLHAQGTRLHVTWVQERHYPEARLWITRVGARSEDGGSGLQSDSCVSADKSLITLALFSLSLSLIFFGSFSFALSFSQSFLLFCSFSLFLPFCLSVSLSVYQLKPAFSKSSPDFSIGILGAEPDTLKGFNLSQRASAQPFLQISPFSSISGIPKPPKCTSCLEVQGPVSMVSEHLTWTHLLSRTAWS